MTLTLIGHEDRYAVEQLQMALFDHTGEGSAVSVLNRGKIWLTAVTTIEKDGKTVTARRRLKADEETVKLRRQTLQQCYYAAAIQLLPDLPPWGALAGVRPRRRRRITARRRQQPQRLHRPRRQSRLLLIMRRHMMRQVRVMWISTHL